MSLNRAEIAEKIAQHGTIARIVITSFDGSTPRETGTAMLVWQTGQSGTIGGGALEHQATQRARAMLPDQTPHLRQTLTLPLGPALGQCCGGMVRLLIERLTSTELATIPETGLYARPLISGTHVPTLLIKSALRRTRSGVPFQPTLTQNWFLEPLTTPLTPIWLYGAGHVGRAIIHAFQDLRFDITWIDTHRDRFPETPKATMLVATNPADAVAHAPNDAIHIVLTYSHAIDLELCHRILNRPFAQLHLIGSASKRARFTSRLRTLGHNDPQIARIICPLGNKSLGKHPAAIAVGLAVALLQDQARAVEHGQTGERSA